MALSVTIDPSDSGRLIFSQPITPPQASAFLWTRPPASRDALRPDPGERPMAGAQRRFLIDKSDLDLVFSLQHGLANQYVRRIQPIMAKAPATLPAWMPAPVREQVLAFKLPTGVHRFPGIKPWGDIVIWIRQGTYMQVEAYQEYPEALDFYTGMAGGNARDARLLRCVYAQFNADMRLLVEQRRMSPSDARDELRRINDEVLKLVVEGAVTMLNVGGGVAAVNATMRSLSNNIIVTARRSQAVRIKPINGKLNVGGGHETPHMTNLNPIKAGSGGPSSGIPNHVRGYMEDMEHIFVPRSVAFMMSSRLRFVDVDWTQATLAAAKVMQAGGKVEMNIWCQPQQALIVKKAFEHAGFRNVTIRGEGTGTMFFAFR